METQKIVINACYGGFGLSHEAVLKYAEWKGIKLFPVEEHSFWHYYKVPEAEYKAAEQESINNCGNYKEINEKDLYFSSDNIPRDCPILIQVVEEMGKTANGLCANLKIVEIPAGVNYEIEEYDGYESIHEIHRSWN